MKAVILCGGKGTRIQNASEVLPKPMLMIGDRPILWHIMKLYAHHGIKEFILCLGYKGCKIKEYFLDYKVMTNDITISLAEKNEIRFNSNIDDLDWQITMAETGDEVNTGGRLWKVRKYLDDQDHFCLTYGDGVADINISELVGFHKKMKKIITVTGVRPSGRFGEMRIERHVVTHFHEKPNVSEGWINGGFMVVDANRIWDYLWPEETLNLEKETLPALAKDGEMCAYQHSGFWQCMDTIREFDLLNELWQKNISPWKIWK